MTQINSILRSADGHHHILTGGLNALDSADRWSAVVKVVCAICTTNIRI
jgi:hypothetical protein